MTKIHAYKKGSLPRPLIAERRAQDGDFVPAFEMRKRVLLLRVCGTFEGGIARFEAVEALYWGAYSINRGTSAEDAVV